MKIRSPKVEAHGSRTMPALKIKAPVVEVARMKIRSPKVAAHGLRTMPALKIEAPVVEAAQ